MTEGVLKALGIGATVVGFGATLLSDYIGKKQQEQKIEDEVSKAFARMTGEVIATETDD